MAKNSVAQRSEYAKPPTQVPKIAGAPPSRPRTKKCDSAGLLRTKGATIPNPSVTLCTIKPITRNAPNARAPVAYDAPMASPSPKLCKPMPSAMRYASCSRWEASSGARPRVHSPTATMARKLTTTPIVTRPVPWKGPGTRPEISSASLNASTPRKINSPIVRLSKKFMPRFPIFRKNGNHSSPIPTGITPT